MKLSIFTTITEPETRGDIWREATNCYEQLADEVIVVDGYKQRAPGDYDVVFFEPTNVKHIFNAWPKEFNWPFIGEQFQKGYEACTGDVVIHADLDFIFHEKDFVAIRKAAQRMLNEKQPAVSFFKYQFVLPDRYNLKSRLVIMVNKRDFGKRIRFDSGGDLCQPSLDGINISPDSVPECGIPFYNYEKLTKTKAQVMDDVGRMERAYKRHFGKTQYGSDGTDEDAYRLWIDAQKGKFNKPQEQIKLEQHPKYLQETIKNLKPEQFGYNAHGNLERNNYVKSSSNIG